MLELSAHQARHLSLDALGFYQELGSISQVLERLGLYQLDSVNVFQRAHLMPAFSRLGGYDMAQFETLAFGSGGGTEFLEYWAHCAALIPRDSWKLFEFRRKEYLAKESVRVLLDPKHPTASWIISELRTNGPMTISQFEHDLNHRKGGWWGWSEVKVILERLFFAGVLISAGRQGFSRKYALAEQIPGLDNGTLSEAEQKTTLLLKAAVSLGVGTEADLADYYRFTKVQARPHIQELLLEGSLQEVSVQGWSQIGYLATEFLTDQNSLSYGQRPLRIINPFDPLTWNRERTRRIFDFDYQIEIYTPEPKRQFGYYTLPILFQDRLIGRVDLKHERKLRALDVRALWHEGLSAKELGEIEPWLSQELKLVMTWIGAETLIPPVKGNWTFCGRD